MTDREPVDGHSPQSTTDRADPPMHQASPTVKLSEQYHRHTFLTRPDGCREAMVETWARTVEMHLRSPGAPDEFHESRSLEQRPWYRCLNWRDFLPVFIVLLEHVLQRMAG
ncbi:MAG: hypothetical protein RLY86_2366 [Pseudomonadota bacterium]|jgi:hypothetical protein